MSTVPSNRIEQASPSILCESSATIYHVLRCFESKEEYSHSWVYGAFGCIHNQGGSGSPVQSHNFCSESRKGTPRNKGQPEYQGTQPMQEHLVARLTIIDDSRATHRNRQTLPLIIFILSHRFSPRATRTKVQRQSNLRILRHSPSRNIYTSKFSTLIHPCIIYSIPRGTTRCLLIADISHACDFKTCRLGSIFRGSCNHTKF
jgi:hypothetical protein